MSLKYLTTVKQIGKNFFIALLVHTFIIAAIYLLVQPDPKGIGFGISLMLYGWLLGLSGIVSLIVNFNPYKIIYQFIMIGCLIYVYWVFKIGLSAGAVDFNIFTATILTGLAVCVILWVNFVDLIFSKKDATS